MKRSRDGSRSRKNRIKENRTRCRETEQNPSLLHREVFFFRKEIKRLPCRCAAGAEGLRSMGIGASTSNKQKRLGSTQTLLASFFAMMECRLRGDQLLRLEWYCYDEKLSET